MKSAMSRLGPLCIETLEKVLKDRKSGGGVKARAALTILKLIGVEQLPKTAVLNEATDGAQQAVKRVFDGVYEEIEKASSSKYVIDAEDAEVIDESSIAAPDGRDGGIDSEEFQA